jgi:hypothetical protein
MAGVTTDIVATPVTAIRRAMTFTATRADPARHGAMVTAEATPAQAGAADEGMVVVMVVVMAGEAVAVAMAEVVIGR